MDNASNNDAAMTELEVILAEKNVKFDAREQRIRCYPHIINICVSHIVKSLGKVDDEVVDDEVNDGGEEGSINDTDDIRKNTLSLERPRKYPKGCPNTT